MTEYKIFTIGFTKKSAESFFGKLKKAGVKKIIDVRLNNKSQLAAFTKKDDLIYFLDKLLGIKYRHEPLLAPAKEILNAYKKKEIGWPEYKKRFLKLLKERKAQNLIDIDELDGSCFLCSEAEPDNCHRRLVAEYMKKYHKGIVISHL